MAVSVTTDLATASLSDTTTDGGTHYRLNGTNTGNPAADADAYVQGSGCVACKMGAQTGAVDVGSHFNHTTTFDLTNKMLFYWRQIVTPGNMLTKANQGITLGLTNTSTTSTNAWSTTNYKKWYMDGSDTMPIAPGWVPYTLDPTITADASAGTLTLTTVKNIGFMCRQNTGITTTVSNQFVDAIRMGTGITATTTAGGDVLTFANIYAVDNTGTNRWGVITQSAGIYYGAGKINVGAAGQAQVCNLTDTDQVFVWRKNLVLDTFYEFKLLGAASFNTTFQLTGSVIRGQSGQKWNPTSGANSKFKLYGCSLSNLNAATLSSTSVLDGCSISASGTIDTNGAQIINCSFSGQTATQLKVDSTGEMAVITKSSFTSGGTGHAIEITATGSYDLSDLLFTNFGTTGTTNAAIYNNSGGAVTLNVLGTAGNSPTYLNGSGASTTVVSGTVTASLTVTDVSGTAIQSATVLVKAAAGGPFPFEVTVTSITNSSTTATVNHTAHGMLTGDKVLIKGASHYQNNGVFTITKLTDNSYSYTMASAPGSNPTGTIKSTFVVLSGSTNASGQLSMSRVFPSSQPVTGWARKSTGSPLYKTGQITGTVSSSTGAALSSLLILDE